MEKICTALLGRTFEMPLSNCQLQQGGTAGPVIYSGPGLVTQDSDGGLRLRVFADVIDVDEAMRREFDRPCTPGQLLPDTEYFDFHGIDQHGAAWTAKHLTLYTDFGTGTYIHAPLRRLENVEPVLNKGARSAVTAFIPEVIDLPWHAVTTTSERGSQVDRFEHETDHFNWVVKKVENGMWLHFAVKDGPVESHFTEFWRALSILTGRALRSLVLTVIEHGHQTIRLVNRSVELDSVKMLPPIRLHRSDAQHAHVFLKCFLAHAAGDGRASKNLGQRIHQLWHRILRARENDIENSSLVLSVVIESLIKEAFASDNDVDAEFAKQIEHARPIIEKAGLQERALKCVRSSFANALRPKVQDVVRRLIEEGVAHEGHLKVWKKMRNAATHGDALVDDPQALQAHLDRYHTCLDLFYRLMFKLVGFSGTHQDFSAAEWPDRTFVLEPRKQP